MREGVRTGRIDLMAGYFLTEARRQHVDFIAPPFLRTPSVIWVRQDNAFAYQQWADLKGRKGGTLVNNSHGQQFDEYAQASLTLEAVPTARQAFEKLIEKRSFEKAALVGDDLMTLIENFDPRKYFPDLFASFGALLSANVSSIAPHWDRRSSLEWKTLQQFYQVDIRKFVGE